MSNILRHTDDLAPDAPLGGKAGALARLGSRGLPIPEWFVVTPGESDRAANELMLKLLKNRKFASTPATRLKSPLVPDGCRDRKMAPMSELLKMSRRTRPTV